MSTFELRSESLAKILEIAGSREETLSYFQSSLNEKINAAEAQADFSDFMPELERLIDNAIYQEQRLSQLDPWSGSLSTLSQLHDIYKATEFSGFQDFMASKSANSVPVEQITLDCMIGDGAEFKRAYSINGQQLDGEALDAMDTLFNAWLAQPENNMIMKDGVIYAAADSGEIKPDQSAAVALARAEKIREMLRDNTHGFEHYVQQKKESARVNIVQHNAEKDEPMPS